MGDCRRVLRRGGLVIAQSDCCFEPQGADSICEALSDLRRIHREGQVAYCSMYTPMYSSGQLGCTVATKESKLTLDAPQREVPKSMQEGFKYYSKDMHRASFVL